MHEMSQGQELPRGVGLTSLIIAQARAIESGRPDRLIDDPFAQQFVDAAGAAFAAESVRNAGLLRLRGDFIAVRTRFFDDYLLAASSAGCRQVALLAAGLDARAFRLVWPAGITLFELDLPEVLAFKEQALARVSGGQPPRSILRRIVVPVDLRQDWPHALLASGFRPGEPAAWLLEGILMYLAEDERDRLLRQVGDLSAPGSQLALDQRGVAPARSEDQPANALEPETERRSDERAKETDAAAARLGVRIPGSRPAPSESDFAGWLAGHGWSAEVFNGVERLRFYGREVEPEVAQAAAATWLARAILNRA